MIAEKIGNAIEVCRETYWARLGMDPRRPAERVAPRIAPRFAGLFSDLWEVGLLRVIQAQVEQPKNQALERRRSNNHPALASAAGDPLSSKYQVQMDYLSLLDKAVACISSY
jgi:hypothetical protein